MKPKAPQSFLPKAFFVLVYCFVVALPAKTNDSSTMEAGMANYQPLHFGNTRQEIMLAKSAVKPPAEKNLPVLALHCQLN